MTRELAKYSPGPWQSGSGNYGVIRDAKGFLVAECASPTTKHDTPDFGNSCMIRSAPTMHDFIVKIALLGGEHAEEAQKIIEAIGAYPEDDDEPSEIEQVRDARGGAAALAMETGS